MNEIIGHRDLARALVQQSEVGNNFQPIATEIVVKEFGMLQAAEKVAQHMPDGISYVLSIKEGLLQAQLVAITYEQLVKMVLSTDTMAMISTRITTDNAKQATNLLDLAFAGQTKPTFSVDVIDGFVQVLVL